MPESVPESDMLALVEGTLAPERAAEVVRALRADPAARARVERMAADRAALLHLPDAIPAPARTVETAMRRAAEPAAPDRRATSRRRTSMLVAAGLGFAVLAGVLAMIINATHPALRAHRLANAPATPARQFYPAPTGPEVIGPDVEEAEGAEIDPTTTTQDLEQRFAAIESEPDADPLLDAFLSRFEPAASDTPAPGAGSDGAQTQGPAPMPGAEVAALLREGTLGVRITVDPAVPAGAIDHADGDGVPPRTEAPRALPASVSLDLPEGASDAELLEALERALHAIRARSGVRVEFVRASTPEAAPAPLATDPGAVLWWTGAPESWRTMRSREVPILVTPEPASSADPQRPASG